jgi:hypothetical protein
MKTVTIDLQRVERLRKIAKDGKLLEVEYVKKRIHEAEAQAYNLYILFGGIIDQSAVDEVVYWRLKLDSAYIDAYINIGPPGDITIAKIN